MKAGLGYPRKVYTQNGSEHGNFILKHRKNANALNKSAKQSHLSIWQCAGREGDFLTTNKPVKLEEGKFYNMTEEQKQRAFEKFCAITSDEPPCFEDSASSLVFFFISISLEETNILHVLFPKLKDIFTKANQILSSAESDIHQCGRNGREHGTPVIP